MTDEKRLTGLVISIIALANVKIIIITKLLFSVLYLRAGYARAGYDMMGVSPPTLVTLSYH